MENMLASWQYYHFTSIFKLLQTYCTIYIFFKYFLILIIFFLFIFVLLILIIIDFILFFNQAFFQIIILNFFGCNLFLLKRLIEIYNRKQLLSIIYIFQTVSIVLKIPYLLISANGSFAHHKVRIVKCIPVCCELSS